MTDNKVSIAKRSEDYSRWYLDVVREADLAEHSPVRGCMIIKPHGYALWENMHDVLDRKFKETGHRNAYFPLFVPKSFLGKEASHVEGFAKECAVVTHHRLIENPDGEGVIVDPEAKLEEEVVVRPTSETIMYDAYSRWIKSWRDLPLLINQWANVVRWEMRTRLFLRTAEFLWQEGHTAHATHEGAEEEALKMLNVYKDFAENWMAMPVLAGSKPEHDKFPGALVTYCIEAMMQDKKALQAGTSHDLGQNFAKAFDVSFADKDGEEKYVWQTCWGVSTRLIGGLIMQHSDDRGLVLPPRIAPVKLVIIPIGKEEEQAEVMKFVDKARESVSGTVEGLEIDDRQNYGPGFKFTEWERKGVPLRMEIGPKDVENGGVTLVRRDSGEKSFAKIEELAETVPMLLSNIQADMLAKARDMMTDNSKNIDSYEELKEFFAHEGGFAYAHWCGKPECDEKVTEEIKASIRCIPFDQEEEFGKCVVCGGESKRRVAFAKSY